jgi:hypothetical protein
MRDVFEPAKVGWLSELNDRVEKSKFLLTWMDSNFIPVATCLKSAAGMGGTPCSCPNSGR